jgi:predicted RNA-binding protein (TIGR00451 family)
LQSSEALLRIRKTADYQFGREVGEMLFPDSVTISFSKKTGRVRHIFLEGKLLATLRPTDGMFSLTINGAKRTVTNSKLLHHWVRVNEDAASFIAEGKSVFAKHVTDADIEIRPLEEVIVLNKKDEVLAVGRAILTGREMKAFKRGVAVKVRRGIEEES